MGSNYYQYHRKNAKFWISPLVNSKDGVDIAMLFTRRESRNPNLSYAMEGEGKEQIEALEVVYRGFAVELFCIYCLLAVPFYFFTLVLLQ